MKQAGIPSIEERIAVQPGYYELQEDVVNPRPHKGQRAWFAQPLWKKGQRFIVDHETDVIGKDEEVKLARIRLRAMLGGTYDCIVVSALRDDRFNVDLERWSALVPRLQKLPYTIGQMMHETGLNEHGRLRAVVAMLVDQGKINHDDLKLAASIIGNMDLEEDDEFCRKHGLP